MLEVIQSIPEQIHKQLDYFQEQESALAELSTKRIHIIASGTSYNAAFTAKIHGFKHLNLDISLYYPNFFNNNTPLDQIKKEAIYIFISQGGKTKAVLESLEKVKQAGASCISLTEDEGSPIAKASDFHLKIGGEKEPFIFRTSGFSLTTVTLYMLFISLAKNNQTITAEEQTAYFEELLQVEKEMPSVINQAVNWYEEHLAALLSCQQLFFAGGSELWPVAQEADIKFMEMLPLVTRSFEIEELIHGPQNCFTSDIGFFLLAENKEDLVKARGINQFLAEQVKSTAFLITREGKEANEYSIESKATFFYPLLYMTFFQVISYSLAVSKNRDLKVRLNATIDMYFEKMV